jgi:hypothetical protein
MSLIGQLHWLLESRTGSFTALLFHDGHCWFLIPYSPQSISQFFSSPYIKTSLLNQQKESSVNQGHITFYPLYEKHTFFAAVPTFWNLGGHIFHPEVLLGSSKPKFNGELWRT